MRKVHQQVSGRGTMLPVRGTLSHLIDNDLPQKSGKSFQKRWKRKRLCSLINEGIMVKLRVKEIHTL
jgi:hypothetical protein